MIKSFLIVLLCFNCAFAQNDSLVFAFISGKCTDTIWKEQTLRRFDLLLQDDIIFDKKKLTLMIVALLLRYPCLVLFLLK